MPLAVYIKKPPKIHKVNYFNNQVEPDNEESLEKRKKRERFFFGFISLVGFGSMIFAIWPLFTWYLITLPKFTHKVEIVPIPSSQLVKKAQVAGSTIRVVKDPDGFSYFTTNYKPQGVKPLQFYLSIPTLDIENAIVKVDNPKFDKNLSHFPGSALPGDVGNSFITGHSVLPQFADSENYHAIFTKLGDLNVGDIISVEIESKKLQFAVQYSKIVDPHDLSVLAPISQSGRNLTLMTCVPPGTNTKRLVVITSLI